MIVGESKIETRPAKQLIGMRNTISQAQNETAALWRSFMPRRKEVGQAIGTELYAVRVYPAGYFSAYQPEMLFEIWAGVEAQPSGTPPAGMEHLAIPAGMYARFTYRGHPRAFAPDFIFMMNEWLPRHSYALDERPHVAVMGEKYRNNEPDSEEEIWMPIRALSNA